MTTKRRSGLTPEEWDDIRWMCAYWEWLAVTPPSRVWTMGGWSWMPRVGDDEHSRRTLAWGHWVLALWYCRCPDCRSRREHLDWVLEQG